MQIGYTHGISYVVEAALWIADVPGVFGKLCMLMKTDNTWHGGAIIGANTSIDKLPAKVRDFWVGYGHQMVADVTALPARHGAFISNCQEHCQTGKAGVHSKGEAWMDTTVNGTTMAAAFVQWYNATIAAATAGDGVSGGVASGAPLVSPLRWVEQCDVDTCGSDVCG